MTAPLPKQSDAYCTAVREVAEPLRAHSKAAYEMCSAKAAEQGLHTPSAAACLRALEVHDPEVFPPMRERYAAPSLSGGPLAVEPPITRTPW